MRTHLLRNLIIAALLTGCALPASAQLEHLNVNTLIKGLRERKMTELLVHLSEDEKAIPDPADRLFLQVEMNFLHADTAAGLEPADRLAAYEKGIAAFESLVKEHYQNNKRGLWQTDLSLQYVFSRLARHELADDFYEYGVPSPAQRKIYEDTAAAAFEHLIDAHTYLSRLRRELPRDKDYNRLYVNTGRWEEMMDEYLQSKLPFLLAYATWQASLLPDSHPYFATLGSNPKIPLQAKTPAAERARMLQFALDELNNIPKPLREKFGIDARASDYIRSKLLVGLGRYDEAMAGLDAVALKSKDDDMALRSLMSKAIATELKTKQPAPAIAALEALKDHAAVKANIIFLLIISDQQHRLLAKHAGKDKARIEAAYDPYSAFIGDKRLGARTETMRRYLYDRWTKMYGDEFKKTPDALPPMVLVGMAEISMMNGRVKVGEAIAIREEGYKAAGENEEKQKAVDEAYKAGLATAKVDLQASMDISDKLVSRAGVTQEVKSRARFNKALAQYLSDPEDGPNLLRAAAIWVQVAEESPKLPVAEEAMSLAIRFVHNLHVKQGDEGKLQGVDKAYTDATKVLYEKLPDSQVAFDERLYYTFNILQSSGQIEEAIKSYAVIPPGHRDYVEARREKLWCEMQLLRKMPDGQPRSLRRDELRVDTLEIEKVAAKQLQSAADQNQKNMLSKTLGDVVLMRVDIDIDRKAWEEAERSLRNFADDHPDPDLIRLALSRRILVKVKQGQAAEAVKLAQELMTGAGDNAKQREEAAGTIDVVLTELAEEVDTLRNAAEVITGSVEKQDVLARAKVLAESSEKLADMLLDWATQQNLPNEQMHRYRMIKIRSSILTDKREEAMKALRPLATDPDLAEELRVIFLQGEVYFMTGKPEDLKTAVNYFNKIVSNNQLIRITADMTPDERNKAEVSNRYWWLSWLRYIQVLDKLNVHTGQIFNLIGQLQTQDRNLGGPGIRPKLEYLQNKHRK